jgi:hypothetical protein
MSGALYAIRSEALARLAKSGTKFALVKIARGYL